MTRNIARLLNKLQIETEEELKEKLEIIPEEYRRIIEAKWGIDADGTYCNTDALLSKKLGIDNKTTVRRYYEEAISAFCNIPYVMIFEKQKYDKSTYKLAVNYGKFLVTLYEDPSYIPKRSFEEMMAKCNLAMQNLTPTEQDVLVIKFGLNEHETVLMKISDTADYMSISKRRVKSAETKAFKQLRKREI